MNYSLLFRQYWQILFITLSVLWLLAPWVHHENFLTAQLISSYELPGQQWSWLFRLGDGVAALLLVGALASRRIAPRQPWLRVSLLALAIFMIVDIIPEPCRLGPACDLLSEDHIDETLVALLIGFAAPLIDCWYNRGRAMGSYLFLAVQMILAAAYGLGPSLGWPVYWLQYVYQLSLTVWLAWVVGRWLAPDDVPTTVTTAVRQAMAVWIAFNGMLSIVVAAGHLRLFHLAGDMLWHSGLIWVAPYSAVVGVILLYLARQLYRGERRAVYLLLAIMVAEIIRYSLLQPHPVLLALVVVTFAVLFSIRSSFDRNTGALPVSRRLRDALIVIGGVVAAVAIAVALTFMSGRQARLERFILQHDITVNFRNRYLEANDIAAYGAAIQSTAGALAAATGLVVVWSLFRPGAAPVEDVEAKRRRARKLLTEASNSSEDYFKLWPPDKNYFFSADGNGFIAYKTVGSVAFALADPIHRQPRKRAQLLLEFQSFCHKRGWVVSFLLINEKSLKLYKDMNLFQIGSNGVVDIQQFVDQTMGSKWWRWRLNRAEREGFRYEVVSPPHSPELFKELRDVSAAWMDRKGRKEQGFALGYYDEGYLSGCRLHLLRNNDGLVAFTNELPVFCDQMTTVDLLRFRPEADGAMAVLLAFTIRQLAEEGRFKRFDLGFVPLAGVKGVTADLTRVVSSGRFSAAGLEQFKNRFEPKWEKNYIAYDGDIIDLALLALALEKALEPAKDPRPSDNKSS